MEQLNINKVTEILNKHAWKHIILDLKGNKITTIYCNKVVLDRRFGIDTLYFYQNDELVNALDAKIIKSVDRNIIHIKEM